MDDQNNGQTQEGAEEAAPTMPEEGMDNAEGTSEETGGEAAA